MEDRILSKMHAHFVPGATILLEEIQKNEGNYARCGITSGPKTKKSEWGRT